MSRMICIYIHTPAISCKVKGGPAIIVKHIHPVYKGVRKY